MIEPIGGPSAWRDHLEEYGPGIHHIAFQVSELDRELDRLAALDAKLVQRAEFRRGRYAYVDTRDMIGLMLELLQIDGEGAGSSSNPREPQSPRSQ